MRAQSLLVVVAAAALFAGWPLAARLGAISGAIALVALAVVFALSASGGLCAHTVALGALGAFAAGLASPGASVFAGGLLLAGAYAERTTRVRGKLARSVHFGVAVLAGMIAGGMMASFTDAGIAVKGVAVIVAAVLASLPCLVEADDLVAHALEAVAREVDEAASRALFAGADLRRNADDALLDRPTARTVRRTWSALTRLAEARLRVQRARVARGASPASAGHEALSPTDAVLGMLDEKIADHVAALARAYSAVDTARAAELGLDDAALRTVEGAGEALEHVSRAIMDVQR